MVDKRVIDEVICKSIDNLVIKHGLFFQHIRETLREITDTPEEYEILRDDIWSFMEEAKNLDHEMLIMKNEDGDFLKNKNGDRHSVDYTDEMKKMIDTDLMGGTGVLYTMHNHPLEDTCFQSLTDFLNQTDVEKYGITLGKDGLMITKQYGSNYEPDILHAYAPLHNQRIKRFDKKYSKELEVFKKKYPNWQDRDSPDNNKYLEATHDMLQHYISDNIDKETSKLNNKFHTKKYDVRMNVYYVPKK